jgi:4'-phosphopantetheinyl transferase
VTRDRPAWLTAAAAEVPDGDDWLAAAERSALALLRVPARRRDWRLGRWVAKRALGALVGADVSSIEIFAASDGAPEVLIEGLPAHLAISISHRAGVGACLVTPAGMAPGCDLELIEPRADVFARDFFTEGELTLIEEPPPAQRDLLVTVVWSAKESALKALRQGLRLDTRQVEVSVRAEEEPQMGWRALRVGYAGRDLRGWWRTEGNQVLTAVTEPAAVPPVRLV